MSAGPGPRRSFAARGRLALVPPAQGPARPWTPARGQAPPALLRVLLGARLRRARQAQGRSLRDVAAVARVSTGHLSQVERGLAEASSEVLAALCRALGVPLHVLLRAAAVDLTASAETGSSGAAVTLTSLTAVRSATSPAGQPGDRPDDQPGGQPGDQPGGSPAGGGVRMAA